VSLGNKADISGNDILQYAEDDPATSVVLLYLESFGNPRRFGQLARRVARTKPIVVVKSGRTTAGLRAAASHTAGLAASELAVDGLFQQAGVIRADTIDEMFDVAACLDSQPLPPGRRVAIVTNAGGPGILAADACVAGGLDVQSTAAGMTNPVDLIASADGHAYLDTMTRLLPRTMSMRFWRSIRRSTARVPGKCCRRLPTASWTDAGAGSSANRLWCARWHRRRRRRCMRGRKRCLSTSFRNKRHGRLRRPRHMLSGGLPHRARSCRSGTCAFARPANYAATSRAAEAGRG